MLHSLLVSSLLLLSPKLLRLPLLQLLLLPRWKLKLKPKLKRKWLRKLKLRKLRKLLRKLPNLLGHFFSDKKGAARAVPFFMPKFS